MPFTCALSTLTEDRHFAYTIYINPIHNDPRRYGNMTAEQRGSTVLETLREVAERWDLQLLDEDIQNITSDQSVQVVLACPLQPGQVWK